MKNIKPVVSEVRWPNEESDEASQESSKSLSVFTTLESGIRIGQIDVGENLIECWKRMRNCDALVFISRPNMILPPLVLEDIFSIDSGCRSLRFNVQVNDSTRVALHYLRYSGLSEGTRRFRVIVAMVFAGWASFLESSIADKSRRGRSLFERIARRLSLALKKMLDRFQTRILSPKQAVSRKLNAFLLTERFDDLPEFTFPNAVHVALTKNCNLSCVMCPYHSEELKEQHSTNYFEHSERLPEPLFTKLIEEAGRHGAHLSFGQYDEPFVYKHFARWAVRAKEAGCSVSITTNGTLLSAEAAELLISAGIDQISFSLDAASKETYRAIRLDDFDLPLRNLRKLVEVRNRLGGETQLRACLVVQEQNKHEQDSFYELINGLGLDMVSFYNLSVYSNGVWLNPVLNFGVAKDTPKERMVCSQLYDQMAVYPDGNVALCCLTTMYVGYRDDVPYVGNLHDSSLEQLWHSEGYRRIRVEAFAGEFSNSVCRDCTIWHNYQGSFTTNDRGHRVYQNAYETIVYLR